MTITIVVEPTVGVAASLGAVLLGVWVTGRGLGSAGLPGCGIGSGCDAITRGRWSRIGFTPVALLGTVVYLALTAFAVANFEFSHQLGTGWQSLSTTLALVVIGAAAWFMLLQLFVIRRLCGYCTAIHLLACTGAGLLLISQRPWISAAWHIEFVTALVCVVGLAIGQVFIAPRTFAVTKIPPQAALIPAQTLSHPPVVNGVVPLPASVPLASAPEPSTLPKPPAKRRVKFLSGNIVLAVDGWPLLGHPGATHVIAVLFDFTCKECHLLRQLLEAAVAARPDWLAVALVPVPLNSKCNPAITCKSEARAQACDYARLAWAVWLATNTGYAEWDRYVNAEAEVRPYGLALIRANELADLKRFHLRDADPLLDRAVGTGVGLYQASGKPNIPAILLPAAVLNGHIADLPTLLRLLDAHLPRVAELLFAAH